MGNDLGATIVPVVSVDGEGGEQLIRKRRRLYRLTTLLLTAVMGGALVDAGGLFPTYGVDTSHATASAAGYELDVRYATVSRPALATPFDIEVRRAGGFDGPVTVAVSSEYLSIWDENGLDPSPSKETASPGQLEWEFDPPRGDALAISFDARIEPAAQQGKPGKVAVLDQDGAVLVSVAFRTRLRP